MSLLRHPLYDDLLQMLFLYLCPYQLASIQLVNKNWFTICRDENFAREYLHHFFQLNNDAKERLRILLSLGFEFNTSTDRSNIRGPSLVNNLKSHVELLKLLIKVYKTPGERGKYSKIGDIFASFNSRKKNNVKYLKEMVRKVNEANEMKYLLQDFESVKFMDICDIEFKIINAHCWVYLLSQDLKETECIIFSYCGFPVVLKFSQTDKGYVLINNLKYHMNRNDHAIGSNFYKNNSKYIVSNMQSVFDIGYEPVGYDGIDDSFHHFELLDTIYRQLFLKVGQIVGCQKEEHDDDNDELWDSNELEEYATYQYGKNAVSSFSVKPPPKKKRKSTFVNY